MMGKMGRPEINGRHVNHLRMPFCIGLCICRKSLLQKGIVAFTPYRGGIYKFPYV